MEYRSRRCKYFTHVIMDDKSQSVVLRESVEMSPLNDVPMSVESDLHPPTSLSSVAREVLRDIGFSKERVS